MFGAFNKSGSYDEVSDKDLDWPNPPNLYDDTNDHETPEQRQQRLDQMESRLENLETELNAKEQELEQNRKNKNKNATNNDKNKKNRTGSVNKHRIFSPSDISNRIESATLRGHMWKMYFLWLYSTLCLITNLIVLIIIHGIEKLPDTFYAAIYVVVGVPGMHFVLKCLIMYGNQSTHIHIVSLSRVFVRIEN